MAKKEESDDGQNEEAAEEEDHRDIQLFLIVQLQSNIYKVEEFLFLCRAPTVINKKLKDLFEHGVLPTRHV